MLFSKLFIVKGGNELIFNKISNLCKSEGISIAGLEKECGLGNGTIRGWKESSPSSENLKKVANFFNVPIDYFLDDTTDTVR